MRLIIGITGASGVLYGIEFLKQCSDLGVETHLIMSEWGKKNILIETSWKVEDVNKLSSFCYADNNLGAAPASGSFQHDGMIVIPCSMKTVSVIANGHSASLISRAADVTLKEGRKLVLVPRETPLNAIHLENMLKVAKLGVVIAPPCPAMYAEPKHIDDLIKHTVGRMLDQFKIEHNLLSRWEGVNC